MRKIVALVLITLLFCSCAPDRHRKWMLIIDTGMGRANDTVYVEGDHIYQGGWHSVEVYQFRDPTLLPQYPSDVFNDVKYAKEIENE